MLKELKKLINNIFKEEMKGHKMLMAGNRKLPKTIGIFNLPHGRTCPGATAWCKQHCYTIKAERMYKAVLPYRERNWTLAKSPCFTKRMIAEINKGKFKVIRIHESGDFYNQEYLDKWIAIAKALPGVTFFAYTKSYALLNFSKLPKNFIIRASIDETTPLTLKGSYDKLLKAAVLTKDGKAPAALGRTKYYTCPGSCKSCSYCYTKGNKHVAFHQH